MQVLPQFNLCYGQKWDCRLTAFGLSDGKRGIKIKSFHNFHHYFTIKAILFSSRCFKMKRTFLVLALVNFFLMIIIIIDNYAFRGGKTR